MDNSWPGRARFMPGQDLSDRESAEAYQERVGKLLETIPEITEAEEIEMIRGEKQ